MKKLLLINTIVLFMMMFGCTTDQKISQSGQQGGSNLTKITRLQDVIDNSAIKDGSVIDLSDYPDISDYNATINKSLTIKDNQSRDLNNASLQVVSDGVVLTGIKNVSVKTQASLKISGSILSSLNISEASRGRGVSDNAKINPPTVETDNTTVTSAVTVAIENAQIVAETLTADEINLAGMNTQLTLKDKVSNISKITTDKVCQVVLEQGTGANIPNSTDKIKVSGVGELTQIDMTVKEGFTLLALTPMSSIKTLLKKGDSIDFTNLAMLGTYVSASKMKIFRANLTVDFTETFSKLEKNFTVTIGDDKKEIFKDGEPTDFDWTTLENCEAEIDINFQNKSHDYKPFKFNIAVIGADIEDLPEFELKSIEVQTGSAKTEYTVGEALDLRRLLVLGEYQQGKYAYNGIIKDYELNPPNGTQLTTVGTQNVTVTAGGKTETIEITVKEVKPEIKRYAIQFNTNGGEGTMANQDMTCDVSADLTANTFTRTGYTFQGWAETANGDVKYANQARVNNLSATNGTIVTLYAVWTANTYKVTLNNEGVTNIIDVTFDTIVPTITVPTKTGLTFGGYWSSANGQGTQYIEADGKGKKWDIANNTTLYAKWNEKGSHNINYKNTKGASIADTYKSFKESQSVTLTSITADGYTFGGWSVVTNDGTSDTTIDHWNAGAYIGDVILWAKWTANTYKVTLNNDGNTSVVLDVTYDTIVPSIIKPTKTGYTFGGYWTVADGQGIQYIDATGDGTKLWNVTHDATLIAKWTANQYDVTYKDQGDNAFSGTFENGIKPTKHTYGSDTALVSPTKEHYRFDGWYIESDCSSSISSLSATGYTDTITLYAKWTPIAYTVIFNANNKTDGTDATSCQQIFCSESTVLNSKPDSFTKDGFSFVRWCDCQYGVGNSYLDGATVKDLTGDTGSITLYAIWKDINNVIDNGNIKIGNTTYSYTSFAKVMDNTVDITGSVNNYSYLANGVDDSFKGVFIAGRNVKLSPYSIGKYEVTQLLFEAVMKTQNDYNKNANNESGPFPAYYVSWYDAITFCNKLSLLMGKEPCYSVKLNGMEVNWTDLKYSAIPGSDSDQTVDWNNAAVNMNANGYRLPTEAEWEFAARGGDYEAQTWGYAFAGQNILSTKVSNNLQSDSNLTKVGWYGNSTQTSSVHTVGKKAYNNETLQLCDMSGNLLEWCWDWYNSDVTINDNEYKDSNYVINPLGPDSVAGCTDRCCRGGHSYYYAYICSVSYRNNVPPGDHGFNVGFRIACSGSGE